MEMTRPPDILKPIGYDQAGPVGPPMLVALDLLENEVERMHKDMDLLWDRLSPVMREVKERTGSDPEIGGPGLPESCLVVRRLAEVHARLVHLRGHLSKTLRRLDL